MQRTLAKIWPILLVGAGILLVGMGLWGGEQERNLRPLATATPEPIIPTRTPVGTTPTEPAAVATVTAESSAVPTPLAGLPLLIPPAHNPITTIVAEERFGVTFPEGWYSEASRQQGLEFGSYLNWHADLEVAEGTYWRMVRVGETGITNDTWEGLTELAQANPGTFWLVGNEMDVKWQDNTTAERYAEIYHEVYTHLKTADPTAHVGIGGVSQPTPLRMAYLDRVLLAYATQQGEPLPTDFWNVHAFILPEQLGSWGVDMPPGMDDQTTGIVYDLDEHDDLAIFAANLIAFREWMAARGYRERPLVVSEYGILMPPDYGFDEERVGRFLQGTLDWMTTAADPETGYPADENRLVQWWFWYAVYDSADRYPAGNFYDPTADQLTSVGEIFATYPRR